MGNGSTIRYHFLAQDSVSQTDNTLLWQTTVPAISPGTIRKRLVVFK